MPTHYVTCHTPDNFDHDRRLQGLGGPGWWYTVDQIIIMIERQFQTFFTRPVFGEGALVVVATHPTSGRKYLKTQRDGLVPNNLLSLPRCPA